MFRRAFGDDSEAGEGAQQAIHGRGLSAAGFRDLGNGALVFAEGIRNT
jgi:hypothetical protein